MSHKIYNKDLVYFDNAATTQKPNCVIDKIREGYTDNNANIHRGVHFLSQKATEEHENARVEVQNFIHAKSSNEIIFTRGTTESINLVAFSFGETFCKSGDEIIISEMEHHANIVSWQLQEPIRGIKLKVIPINDKGELMLDEMEKLISPKTRLISVTHVSNVLGTVNPVDQITEIAHKHNIPVLIDAAQSVQWVRSSAPVAVLLQGSHRCRSPLGRGRAGRGRGRPSRRRWSGRA